MRSRRRERMTELDHQGNAPEIFRPSLTNRGDPTHDEASAVTTTDATQGRPRMTRAGVDTIVAIAVPRAPHFHPSENQIASTTGSTARNAAIRGAAAPLPCARTIRSTATIDARVVIVTVATIIAAVVAATEFRAAASAPRLWNTPHKRRLKLSKSGERKRKRFATHHARSCQVPSGSISTRGRQKPSVI